ncbi:MAG: transporter, partial [Phototrophicales bacterium]
LNYGDVGRLLTVNDALKTALRKTYKFRLYGNGANAHLHRQIDKKTHIMKIKSGSHWKMHMFRRFFFILSFALLIVYLGKVPVIQAQDPTTIGSFATAPCVVEVPEGAVEGRDIICGYVNVPEFYDRQSTNTLRLAVAILPSISSEPAPDPLFMAQGGPGGSTLTYFVSAMTATELGQAFLAERDIVLIEQRGTRYAEPNLFCPELDALVYQNLMTNLDHATEDEQTIEALAQCRTRLLKNGVDLSAYDSIQNAHDMNVVRQALGYERINFYGVSYGTMLVQHYMRAYPNTLRTVILDAVVPLDHNFLLYYPANAQRAFDLLFDTCEADLVCPYMYPDLEAKFYELVTQLNDHPTIVELYDRTTDDYYDAYFSGDDLMSLIFNLMYVTEFIPYLPRIIWETYQGDYGLVAYLQSFYTFNFTLSRGMYYAVLCAEDADFTLDEVVLEGVRPEVAANFRLDRFAPICELWDVERLDDTVDMPVESDIPTLILSGEFDPITPPINGKIVAQTLTRAYVYTLPAVGHGAIDHPCGLQLVTAFLSDPSVPPDPSCIYDIRLTFASPNVEE